MRLHRYGPADYLAMPWKNGRGSTTQLWIDPPQGSLGTGFRCRVSTAEVAESGPFSSFPGMDRTLLLLDGRGLDLDHGVHGRRRLAGPFEPAVFSGDWDTSGQLLEGPCRDFNVMTARGQACHQVTVLRAPAPLPAASTLLVYAARGRAELEGQLDAGQLLRIDLEGDAPPFAQVETATVLVVVALTWNCG